MGSLGEDVPPGRYLSGFHLFSACPADEPPVFEAGRFPIVIEVLGMEIGASGGVWFMLSCPVSRLLRVLPSSELM